MTNIMFNVLLRCYFYYMVFNAEKTITEIVQNDYRTADVFRKHGINYCCSGKVALGDACRVANLELGKVVADLEAATVVLRLPGNLAFHQWTMDFLLDFIINVHHGYVKQSLPALTTQLLLFVDTHRRKHQELEQLNQVFNSMAARLQKHLQYEEEIIFPYIRHIARAHRNNDTYGNLLVRTLRKPLENIEKEDEAINTLLNELAQLTSGYQPPQNACTNHQVVIYKLREFHEDMTQHQYLENKLLFPRAIDIEKQLLASPPADIN